MRVRDLVEELLKVDQDTTVLLPGTLHGQAPDYKVKYTPAHDAVLIVRA